MNIFKRALSMALAMAMVFSMIPTAFAVEGPEIKMGTGTVDVAGGAATVTVPVEIKNNPGFAGMDMTFPIPEGWSITDINTTYFDDNATDYSVFCKETTMNIPGIGPITVPSPFVAPQVNNNNGGVGSLVVAYGNADITGNGKICWITYSIPADAVNGEYDLKVTANKINNLAQTGVNIKDQFTFTPGTITVTGGHDHVFVPGEYVWGADNMSCTVLGTCAAEGATDTATAVVTTKTVDAECGVPGKTVYTATFDKTWAVTQVKETPIDALEHSFTNYVSNNDAKCEVDGTETATCDHGCGETNTRTVDGTALSHVDANHDHKCDNNCGKTDMGAHTDADHDGDHLCDYGCGETASEHNYSSADCDLPATCTECGESTGTALGHKYTNYVSNGDATCEADGTKTAECENGCGETDTVADVGSKLGHSFTVYVSNNDATCTADGTKTAECDRGCGAEDTIADEGTAKGHKYTTYVSNNDATCTADGTKTAECDNGCGETDTVADVGTAKGHKYTNYVSNNDATCEADGTKTAECDNGCGETDTVADVGTAKGHKYTNYVSNNDAKCEVDGTKTAECDNGCGTKDTIADVGTALSHVDANHDHICDNGCGKTDMGAHTDAEDDGDHLCDYGCGVNASEHDYGEADCDSPATCTECGESTGEPIGHDWNVTYTFAPDGSTCTVERVCNRNAAHKDTATAVITSVVKTPATCVAKGWTTYTATFEAEWAETKTLDVEDIDIVPDAHAWNAGVVTTPATCMVAGEKTFTCAHDSAHQKTEPIPVNANAHSWNEGEVTTEPSCTAAGEKTYTCQHNAAHKKTEPIAMLEHNYGNDNKCTVCGKEGPSNDEPNFQIKIDQPMHGEIKANVSHAEKGDKVTLTVEADKGYELVELIVVDKDGDEIKVTEQKNGKFSFKMPAGKVNIEAVFEKIGAADEEIENPFTDVAEKDYFYDAVLWAAENGITNGMTANTFAPGAVCNRAQVVTFLWRAAGCPEPMSNLSPFVDVAPDAYYYDAVLWAVENGITNGMSATEFAPNATVTRGQTVTFLWRAERGDVAEGMNAFTDVEADAYYYSAVQWAVKNGITNGMSATEFAPNAGCTRGQIVTFLYRTFAQ